MALIAVAVKPRLKETRAGLVLKILVQSPGFWLKHFVFVVKGLRRLTNLSLILVLKN